MSRPSWPSWTRDTTPSSGGVIPGETGCSTAGSPSLAANWLIRRVTGVKVHDMGCSLAAYRRDVVVRVRPQLREGLHRFLAVLAASAGARVAEIVVSHRPRRHGRSKYGLSRTVYVVRDLLELSRSRAPTGRRRPAVARSRSR